MPNAASYEVEIRFIVSNLADAFNKLPFLEESLGKPSPWSTDILGRSVFDAGRLLRIGCVPPDSPAHYYLGYKDVDEGTFANIRREWGEEITDGAVNSAILAALGISGVFATPAQVRHVLEEAGYCAFMSFSGTDRLGEYAPLGIQTKAMWCPAVLGTQVLIELELGASSLANARAAEETLRQLAAEFRLTKCLVRDEPPTLLYKTIFKQ